MTPPKEHFVYVTRSSCSRLTSVNYKCRESLGKGSRIKRNRKCSYVKRLIKNYTVEWSGEFNVVDSTVRNLLQILQL